MQNVPFILLRNCQKLSISVPSIAHTEENKTSRSYAKMRIYVGMILDKN